MVRGFLKNAEVDTVHAAEGHQGLQGATQRSLRGILRKLHFGEKK